MTQQAIGLVAGNPRTVMRFRGSMYRAVKACKKVNSPTVVDHWDDVLSEHRISAGADAPLVRTRLAREVDACVEENVQVLAVATNLPLELLQGARTKCKIPFFHLGDGALRQMKSVPLAKRRVGLMCSEQVRNSHLYDHIMMVRECQPVYLSMMLGQRLMQTIYGPGGVLDGNTVEFRRILPAVLSSFAHDGVDAVIVGSPDFPPLDFNGSFPFQLVDPIEGLATLAVELLEQGK